MPLAHGRHWLERIGFPSCAGIAGRRPALTMSQSNLRCRWRTCRNQQGRPGMTSSSSEAGPCGFSFEPGLTNDTNAASLTRRTRLLPCRDQRSKNRPAEVKAHRRIDPRDRLTVRLLLLLAAAVVWSNGNPAQRDGGRTQFAPRAQAWLGDIDGLVEKAVLAQPCCSHIDEGAHLCWSVPTLRMKDMYG